MITRYLFLDIRIFLPGINESGTPNSVPNGLLSNPKKLVDNAPPTVDKVTKVAKSNPSASSAHTSKQAVLI